MTINDYIRFETIRRHTDLAYLVAYLALSIGVVIWSLSTPTASLLPTTLVMGAVCSGVALFQGMSNVVLSVSRIGNPITSTEDEIRTVYMTGPRWFRNLCEEADRS